MRAQIYVFVCVFYFSSFYYAEKDFLLIFLRTCFVFSILFLMLIFYRIITGHILFNQTLLSSLSFLAGLREVDGTPPDQFYRSTLSIQQNTALRSLGLTRLTRIGGQTVVVRDNLGLCLQSTISWDSMMFMATSPAFIFGFTSAYLNSVVSYVSQGSYVVSIDSWVATNLTEHPNCGT
jgi:hypothetical protein